MQEIPLQPFDDPALKAALRRSLEREVAPAALRDRISKLSQAQGQPTLKLSEKSEVPENKPIPMFRRSPAYRMAVAAVLLIAFGGLAYKVWDMNRSPYDPS